MRYSKQRELVLQKVEQLCDHPLRKKFTMKPLRSARA